MKSIDRKRQTEKICIFGRSTKSVDTCLTVPYTNKKKIKKRRRYSIVKKEKKVLNISSVPEIWKWSVLFVNTKETTL